MCSQLDRRALAQRPGTMAAALREAAADADPCQITTGGGYQRLENQLYRVEIHDVAGPPPRFVWSRENGSVVAAPDSCTSAPTTVPGMDAALDARPGRPRRGAVASARATSSRSRAPTGSCAGCPASWPGSGPVIDLVVHVDWLAGAPPACPPRAGAGRAPLGRRTDTLSTGPTDLEGGITVAFPAGGTPGVGDYWLVPARTVRLAYGTSARQGTLDWPLGRRDARRPARPSAPCTTTHRSASSPARGAAWTLESDCRHLFPPLTGDRHHRPRRG